MPATASTSLLILFEDEVRLAGRLLAKLRDLRAAANPDEDALGDAICDALNACMVALAGAEVDAAVLLLARKAELGILDKR